MTQKNIKARVFISCSQRSPEEKTIVGNIKKLMTNLGYDYYLSIEQENIDALRSNTFQALSSSEYFLLIDFKREKLGLFNKRRGSLYRNQEFAIAAFLEIPSICLQEQGMRTNDGMAEYFRDSFHVFRRRDTLASLIEEKMTEENWRPNWKNRLIMKRDRTEFSDTLLLPPVDVKGIRFEQSKKARFYHVNVENLNPHEAAENCCAYLEEIIDLSSGKCLFRERSGIKWQNSVIPDIRIPETEQRNIDSFYVLHDIPADPVFALVTAASQSGPEIRGPGDFRLTYSVTSDNVDPATKSFRLSIGKGLDGIRFEETVQDAPE